MTNKQDKDGTAAPIANRSIPGMMGDGSEEQNLDQTGNPEARITEKEVRDAFAPKSDDKGEADEKGVPGQP